MSLDPYAEIPYITSGSVLPSPLALVGGAYVLYGIHFSTQPIRCMDIGCGAGVSTIELARSHPEIEFVGIDITQEQINLAEEKAQSLKLANVSFRCMDFMDLANENETYDVVYCYGLLSWCPSRLWSSLFQVMRNILAPNGLAFISYNVYPGWYFKGYLRDIMRLEADDSLPPEQSIHRAKTFTRSYCNALPKDSVYRYILEKGLNDLKDKSDIYLYHEYLESDNHAFRFSEFNQLCKENHLCFATEFPFVQSSPAVIPKNHPHYNYIKSCYGKDLTRFEQAMDLVLWRSMRRSILFDKNTPLSTLDTNRFQQCRLQLGPLKLTKHYGLEDLLPGASLKVNFPYGGSVEIDHPHEIAILFSLKQPCSYDELWETIQQAPAVKSMGESNSEETVQKALWRLVQWGCVMAYPF